ncbi:MAG: flagellin [Phycisphaerales bacterium]
MSSIPANLARVPNLLSSQTLLRHLTGTNVGLLEAQEQLSTGRRIVRGSDDPIGAALVGLLDNKLETTDQRERNLSHASSTLDTIDAILGEISDLSQEARSIALSQVGVGSDATTRKQQSTVIGQLKLELFQAINRDFVGVSLFAGSKSGSPAYEPFYGGYRYLGDDKGLATDLGFGLEFPITINAQTAVGATSARVKGDVDLDPILTPDTFLTDLRGPMAINDDEMGAITVTVTNGGDPNTFTIDLSNAETVGDVQDLLNQQIEANAPGALAGVGVGVTIDRFSVTVAAGYTITFDDGGVGQTAAALGLDGIEYAPGVTTDPDDTADLNPKITDRTLLSDLDPTDALEFGEIRFTNGDRSGTVTIDPDMTVGQFRQAVAQLDLGIAVSISDNGDSLDVINQVAGLRMSVAESGGTLSATTLGIRSLQASTPTTLLNDGRGVEIAHGHLDPDTGLPDPQYNNDFQVNLSDGTSFTVDLTPDDMVSIQSVIDRINQEATDQGIAGFTASLNPDGNGIMLADTLGGADAISVTTLNGFAAEDLGLLNAQSSAGQLIGEDRATVAVDSLFTTLIDLERSLATNDERGIQFATAKFDADIDRAATARAMVGSRAQRVEATIERLQLERTRDEAIRSQIRDVDPFEVSTRFQLLQAQLQTTIAAAAQNRPLSLLSFL